MLHDERVDRAAGISGRFRVGDESSESVATSGRHCSQEAVLLTVDVPRSRFHEPFSDDSDSRHASH